MSEKPAAPTPGSPEDFRGVADALRARVDLFGKTLAGLATIATGAVGLEKIGDLFPATNGWLVLLACVSLGAAAIGAIAIAVRLMKVSRPVFLRADLDTNEELSAAEREAVRPVFAAAAGRFGYRSLIGLQERERSLRRAAAWCPDEDERARRTAQADEVRTEIEGAMARGMVVTVRLRATAAVSDGRAWAAYAAIIIGLVAFAVTTDKVSSDRVDLIAKAKACGEAREKGATADELGRTADPDDDGPWKGCEREGKDDAASGGGAADLSKREAQAKLLTELAPVLRTCRALVAEKAPSPDASADAKSKTPLLAEDCAAIREAVVALNE